MSRSLVSFDSMQPSTSLRNGGGYLHLRPPSSTHELELESHKTYLQQKKGIIDKEIIIPNDGWIAARIKSETRDSFFQPVWAHTSPIYISVGNDKILERVSSANHFIKKIDESLEWIDKKGKFYSNKQRKEILDLHREAKSLYKKLVND